MDKIVERIEHKAGVPGLAAILAEQLSPTDLQSLLLEVYRIRSSRIQPSTVLSDFESNRFVRPSTVPPISLLRWEQIAFAHLPPEFEPIALSPVCPLGTNSIVAPVDQNLCFHIHATATSGQQFELVDGDSVDWTQEFLSNAKERLVISGIGSERLCTEFENAA